MTARATRIAIDLTAINELAERLPTEAIHHARSHTMPGGEATAALAPVANLEAWNHRQQTLEHQHEPHDHDTDPTPLQRLCTWTERIRRDYNLERDQQPTNRTYTTETNLIRWQLNTLETDLTHTDLQHLEDDIHDARTQLENILRDGLRDIVSDDVTCLACDEPLRRRMTHDNGYEDDWWCPTCHQHLTLGQFNLAAMQAARHAIGLES